VSSKPPKRDGVLLPFVFRGFWGMGLLVVVVPL
jgi:hypothetical protein